MPKKPGSGKGKNKPVKKITVNSQTYGEHERAARGTYKKAELNDAMKAHGKRMIGSNTPAALIQDALRPYRMNFSGGQLWQEMVKRFAAQAKEGREYSVMDLQYLSFHTYYTVRRMGSSSFEINTDLEASVFEMKYTYIPAKAFLDRAPYLTGFQTTIIALFPDFKKNTIITESVVLPVRALKDAEPFSFIINIPPQARACLLCCKVEGTEKGVVLNSTGNVTKGMYFMHAQEFERLENSEE